MLNRFMQTWIKFCGTTSLEDALASVEAGATSLGFIFAPSKRRVTPENAQAIIERLPPGVERIGVFLSAALKEIRNVVTTVDLTGIQLHGNEFAPEVYDYLLQDRRAALRIIKTIIVQDGFEGRIEMSLVGPGVIDAWLLDSGAGSGKTFDWQAARTQLGGRQGRFIVAGGL